MPPNRLRPASVGAKLLSGSVTILPMLSLLTACPSLILCPPCSPAAAFMTKCQRSCVGKPYSPTCVAWTFEGPRSGAFPNECFAHCVIEVGGSCSLAAAAALCLQLSLLPARQHTFCAKPCPISPPTLLTPSYVIPCCVWLQDNPTAHITQWDMTLPEACARQYAEYGYW